MTIIDKSLKGLDNFIRYTTYPNKNLMWIYNYLLNNLCNLSCLGE